MDLERVKLEVYYRYVKFTAWKWRLTRSWIGLSNLQKVMVSLGFTGSVVLFCFVAEKYLERRHCSSGAKGIDHKEEQLISTRRKNGIPPGLYNEGNSCFANSILQALSCCTKFSDWLDNALVSPSSNQLTIIPSVQKLMKILSNKYGNDDVYSASDVINSLCGYGWVISSEQHDAYEFFQSLISTAEEEARKMSSINHDLTSFTTKTLTVTIANKISRNLPQINKPHPYSPFKGSFANRLSCLTCGYQYPIKFEQFNSLILNLKEISKLGCTLESCFEKFTQSELLSDVSCDQCAKKSNRNAKQNFCRRMSLAKLPACLCIALQRTFYDVEGRTLKNAMFVKFPEFLDINRYTYRSQTWQSNQASTEFDNKVTINNTLVNRPSLRGGKSLLDGSAMKNHSKRASPSTSWYRLVSVVLHYGNAYDGHFVTYRRLTRNSTDRWFYISDECVRVVPKEQVFKSSAYLLFYEKL